MPAVCLYFEVHQPYRLRPYDVFQVGQHHNYFDDRQNAEIIQRVARRCYLPANQILLRLIEKHGGRFKVAFSITGSALEQLQAHAPEVVESFRALVATGCVELVGETYYHALASVFDAAEFREQVRMHRELMQKEFGVSPSVFRNTELIYDDELAGELEELGFRAALVEGADDVLASRNPHRVYRAPDSMLSLLCRDYRLSDDIAFRFTHPHGGESKLTARHFAESAAAQNAEQVVNLFMDYETFGEHHVRETGIFSFLEELPDAILAQPGFQFATPSEVVAAHPPRETLSFARTTSWADTERDLSAWLGNDMQQRALQQLYTLGARLRRRNNEALLERFRRLTTSDHAYYMCTKWFGDDDVHSYFSPYESPYEAFINFMNVLTDLDQWAQRTAPMTLMPEALEPESLDPDTLEP